jgi:hypothetical protein
MNFGEGKCVEDFSLETRRKVPLGRFRLRWEGNIKNDLKDIGGRGRTWLI